MRCKPRWMLQRGESRALPVADEARRASGSGQNFGGQKDAAKFWVPQQDIAAAIGTKRWCGANPDGCYSGIAAEIDTKNMPLAYFLNVSTPACFLNAPTLSVLAALGHLSQRERQGVRIATSGLRPPRNDRRAGRVVRPYSRLTYHVRSPCGAMRASRPTKGYGNIP